MIADFSHYALWLAGLATVAQAYTAPVGDVPSGNPIAKPGLNEVVPVGSPYIITWAPTTSDCSSVDLVLLRGPSNNIKPLYAIAEGVANTGTYSWTPSTSLEPDTTHYGIQLICDQSGAYQYTTQFGISNLDYSAAPSVSKVDTGITSTRSVHLASSLATAPSSYSYASLTSTSLSSSSWTTLAYASTGFPVLGNSTTPHTSGTISHKSSSSTQKPTTRTTVLTHTNTPTTTEPTTTAAQTTEATPVGTNGATVARAAVGLMGVAAAAVFAL